MTYLHCFKTKICKIGYALLATMPVVIVFAGNVSGTVLPSTFTAEVTLNLCPEYQYQNDITVEVKYRVGTDVDFVPAVVTSQSLDSQTATGIFRLLLPTDAGKTPIKVAAFCRNSFGLGIPSNELSVTNCDALGLVDTDGDGLTNQEEDLDCNNAFSPGDFTNPDSADTDDDGDSDGVEVVSATDPANPGSGSKALVTASTFFDYDGDGNSNAIAWRANLGTWYVQDGAGENTVLAFVFGLPGDQPFTYQPNYAPADVGVIRKSGTALNWLFRGTGFLRNNGTRVSSIFFGSKGDRAIPGPWELLNVTNPAVAQFVNGHWAFSIYLSDGRVRTVNWGMEGDIPKPDDYDGDGLFDVAVYRPSDTTLYIISSIDGGVHVHRFGDGSFNPRVVGDYTVDAMADISMFDTQTATFITMISDFGFDDVLAAAKNPNYYQELSFSTTGTDLPLNHQLRGNRLVYTVVDHSTGIRRWFPDNDGNKPEQQVQWGLPGDAQG